MGGKFLVSLTTFPVSWTVIVELYAVANAAGLRQFEVECPGSSPARARCGG